MTCKRGLCSGCRRNRLSRLGLRRKRAPRDGFHGFWLRRKRTFHSRLPHFGPGRKRTLRHGLCRHRARKQQGDNEYLSFHVHGYGFVSWLLTGQVAFPPSESDGRSVCAPNGPRTATADIPQRRAPRNCKFSATVSPATSGRPLPGRALLNVGHPAAALSPSSKDGTTAPKTGQRRRKRNDRAEGALKSSPPGRSAPSEPGTPSSASVTCAWRAAGPPADAEAPRSAAGSATSCRWYAWRRWPS